MPFNALCVPYNSRNKCRHLGSLGTQSGVGSQSMGDPVREMLKCEFEIPDMMWILCHSVYHTAHIICGMSVGNRAAKLAFSWDVVVLQKSVLLHLESYSDLEVEWFLMGSCFCIKDLFCPQKPCGALLKSSVCEKMSGLRKTYSFLCKSTITKLWGCTVLSH